MGLLRRGSRGAEVEQLQADLVALGYDPGPVDGIFGGGTESAVKAFQSARGLSVDGLVGDQTRAALAEAKQEQSAPEPEPEPEPPAFELPAFELPSFFGSAPSAPEPAPEPEPEPELEEEPPFKFPWQ